MSKEIICGIYKITSPTGRIYIGQSINIYSRWKDYRKPSSGCKGQKFIGRSINKYGCEAHEFCILEVCEPENLNLREIFWISFFKSYATKKGMNCSIGGEGPGIGLKRTKQTREKQSRKMKGKYVGAKNPNYGNGEKTRGQNHIMFGKKQPKEKIEKNRESNKKTWAKIIESDWYNSEEQRRRRSEFSKGRRHTQEFKQKLADRNRETWANVKANPDFYSELNIKIRSDRMKRAAITYKSKIDYEEKIKARSEMMKKRWVELKVGGFKISDASRLRMSIAAKKREINKKIKYEQQIK